MCQVHWNYITKVYCHEFMLPRKYSDNLICPVDLPTRREHAGQAKPKNKAHLTRLSIFLIVNLTNKFSGYIL